MSGCSPGLATGTSLRVVGSTMFEERKAEPVATPSLPSLRVDSLLAPFSGQPDFEEGTDRRAKAVRAARVDPGILRYVEPPAGTDMPVRTPPEHVDPEMIEPQHP